MSYQEPVGGCMAITAGALVGILTGLCFLSLWLGWMAGGAS